MNRREWVAGALALCVGTRAWTQDRQALPIDLIEAPSNLGLRPNDDGSLAGTWRAPEALRQAGLDRALSFRNKVMLPRPTYEREAQKGTRIRNGNSLRAFNLALADSVGHSLAEGGFPLVVGGECSNLLGCMLAVRRRGGHGLIHIDGHSDFSHPGNYDTSRVLGAAAGMDLALATGRGEAILTKWPDVNGPLAPDAEVFQIGERDGGGYPFSQVTVQKLKRQGVSKTLDQVRKWLTDRRMELAWIHVDTDVLDESVMPAVDSPGSPGLQYAELADLIAGLVQTGRIAGVDVAIYDPDRDPGLRYGRELVKMLARALKRPTDSAYAAIAASGR
jgi:arginase